MSLLIEKDFTFEQFFHSQTLKNKQVNAPDFIFFNNILNLNSKFYFFLLSMEFSIFKVLLLLAFDGIF